MKDGHEYKLCIKEKIKTDKYYRELSSIDFYDTSEEVKRRINHKIENIVETYPNSLITKYYVNSHGIAIKRVKVIYYSNNIKHESIFWMDFIDCSTKDRYLL